MRGPTRSRRPDPCLGDPGVERGRDLRDLAVNEGDPRTRPHDTAAFAGRRLSVEECLGLSKVIGALLSKDQRSVALVVEANHDGSPYNRGKFVECPVLGTGPIWAASRRRGGKRK
jgi:hypothetical protein